MSNLTDMYQHHAQHAHTEEQRQVAADLARAMTVPVYRPKRVSMYDLYLRWLWRCLCAGAFAVPLGIGFILGVISAKVL